MIPADRVRRMAQQLLEKTRQDRVNWDGYGDESFHVELSQARFVVSRRSPKAKPDSVSVKLFEECGYLVGAWTVAVGEDGWELASALFAEARRAVTGWDRLMVEVEQEIETSAIVGQKREAVSAWNAVPF